MPAKNRTILLRIVQWLHYVQVALAIPNYSNLALGTLLKPHYTPKPMHSSKPAYYHNL